MNGGQAKRGHEPRTAGLRAKTRRGPKCTKSWSGFPSGSASRSCSASGRADPRDGREQLGWPVGRSRAGWRVRSGSIAARVPGSDAFGRIRDWRVRCRCGEGGVTPAWCDTTVRAALRIATGKPAAAAAAAQLASITKEASRAMMTYKMKGSTITVLVFGVVAIGGAHAGTPAPGSPA